MVVAGFARPEPRHREEVAIVGNVWDGVLQQAAESAQRERIQLIGPLPLEVLKRSIWVQG
jgi:hypothetical protein